jgi:hypothetical protein
MKIINFAGISHNEMANIINSRGNNAKIVFPVKAPICKDTGTEPVYYEDSYDDCCYCYDCGPSYNYSCYYCLRRDRYARSKSGRSSSSSSSSSSCDCHPSGDCGDGDCDSGGGDALAVLVIFIVVIMLLFFILTYLPEIVILTIGGMELLLAGLLTVFNLVTFGIFRSRFKGTHVDFTDINEDEIRATIREAVIAGGIPLNYRSHWSTMGFTLFRWGAYLFIPSLITIPTFWLLSIQQMRIWAIPIGGFVLSVFLLWLGNLQILRKKRYILAQLGY